MPLLDVLHQLAEREVLDGLGLHQRLLLLVGHQEEEIVRKYPWDLLRTGLLIDRTNI